MDEPSSYTIILILMTFVINRSDCSGEKSSVAATIESEIRSTVEAVNSTCIFVTWSRASRGDSPPAVAPCPTRYYAVRLKQETWKKARSWRFNASRSSATLCELRPNTQYLVRLVTETTCDVRGRPSRWLTVRTSLGRQTKDVRESNKADSSSAKDDRVPGQPTMVRSRPQSDSVFVSWQPPDGGPVVTGYIVGYGEGVPDVNWQYLEAYRRNATIKNLKKATQYVVSVRAFNEVDKGPVVYELVYTTDDTASPTGDWPTPTSLRTRILSSKTAWFGWTDPSLGHVQQITDNRYYNVHYQATPNGKTMSVIVKDLHVTLHDLIPGTLYEFKVRTIKDGQTSSFSDVVTNKTADANERASISRATFVSSTPARKVAVDRRQQTTSSTAAIFPAPGNKNIEFTENEDDDDEDFANIRNHGSTNLRPTTRRQERIQGNNAPPIPSASLVSANDNDDTMKHDGKMKREHSPHSASATARRDDVTAPGGGQSTPDESDLPTVIFKALVQVKVSAYITWPADVLAGLTTRPCSVVERASEPDVVGYKIRYQAIDNGDDVREYVTQNLSSNFVLLENLSANTRYKYQVRYLLKDGTSTEWSASGYIDTRYYS